MAPMASPVPGSQDWLDLVMEEVVEPDLPIVDSHHHVWPPAGMLPYGADEWWADVTSGHRIEQSVFMECHASYWTEGPEHLRPAGESEFVAALDATLPRRLIAGIVSFADLTRDDVDDVLDAHLEASGGLFRGVRDALARAERIEGLRLPGRAPEGKFRDPSFQRGVARLGDRGFTYDSWHYHYQNREFLELARAVPHTVMVLDHFGTPLGVGPYSTQRDEIFQQWKLDIAELAACPNVVAKLGGMAMGFNGYGWDTADAPPTSGEFAQAQAHYYRYAMECFGPERCMFASNFPIDRTSVSYRVLWNAFKLLTADFSADERTAMFSGTARRVYRLEDWPGSTASEEQL